MDWLETSDEFEGGEALDPEHVEEFLTTIDCYVMGSRTYETALEFEAKGLVWSYGDKPTFRNIWIVGGGAVSGECLRRGLVDEVRYSVVPVLLGDGTSFFEGLDREVELHLLEVVRAYGSGVVALRHEVRK